MTEFVFYNCEQSDTERSEGARSMAIKGVVVRKEDIVHHLAAVDVVSAQMGEGFVGILQYDRQPDGTAVGDDLVRVCVIGRYEAIPGADLGPYWQAVEASRAEAAQTNLA